MVQTFDDCKVVGVFEFQKCKVYVDRRILNSYIAAFEARISTLEKKNQDAFACKSVGCEDIRVAYHMNECCHDNT